MKNVKTLSTHLVTHIKLSVKRVLQIKLRRQI